MEFLKRNYEKVILFAFFLLFIGLMVWIMRYVDVSSEVSEEDLNFRKAVADHVNVDANLKELNPDWMWRNNNMDWRKSVARHKEDKALCNQFSDLVQMFPLAYCPSCKPTSQNVGLDQKFLIPRAAFGSKCPRCLKDLDKVEEHKQTRVRRKSESDKDGDGIPNDKEKEFGLDENNTADALFDKDGDGFSNLYEFENGTDPRITTNHPPFWHRLVVLDIAERPLPFIAMGVNENDSKDKKKWEIQINEERPGRTRPISRFLAIGDTIRIEKREYVIKDVESRFRTEKKQVAGIEGGTDLRVNISRIFLEEVVDDSDLKHKKKDKLVMTVGSQLKSSDKRPRFRDTGMPADKQEFEVKIGNTFRVGLPRPTGRRSPFDEYKLVAVDAEKKTATLQYTVKNGARIQEGEKAEIIVVTADGMIAPDYRVDNNASANQGEDPGMM